MRWKKQAATVLWKCSFAEEISCVQSACLASSITNTVGVFTRGMENRCVMSTWMDQISPFAFMDFRLVHLHLDNTSSRPISHACRNVQSSHGYTLKTPWLDFLSVVVYSLDSCDFDLGIESLTPYVL